MIPGNKAVDLFAEEKKNGFKFTHRCFKHQNLPTSSAFPNIWRYKGYKTSAYLDASSNTKKRTKQTQG